MKIYKYFLLNFLFILTIKPQETGFSEIYKHKLSINKNDNKIEYIWEQSTNKPFKELILSWNAKYPESSKYCFWVRVKLEDWSRWIKIAEWGKNLRLSFVDKNDSFVTSNIDIVSIKQNKIVNTFQVKVEACDGATLSELKYLYVNTSQIPNFDFNNIKFDLKDLLIENLIKQSQMILDIKDETGKNRSRDICSPTSTTTAINILLSRFEKNLINHVDFAKNILDQSHNIFGNWMFNVAGAYAESDGFVSAHIERLNSFKDLYNILQKNIPVVVSVQGYIDGGAKEYTSGHLITIVGWNQQEQKVMVIDSAFPTNDQTLVGYKIKDFLAAWARRKNLAYVFDMDLTDTN